MADIWKERISRCLIDNECLPPDLPLILTTYLPPIQVCFKFDSLRTLSEAFEVSSLMAPAMMLRDSVSMLAKRSADLCDLEVQGLAIASLAKIRSGSMSQEQLNNDAQAFMPPQPAYLLVINLE